MITPGKLVYRGRNLYIINFSGLQDSTKDNIQNYLGKRISNLVYEDEFETLVVKHIKKSEIPKFADLIRQEVSVDFRVNQLDQGSQLPINFNKVFLTAQTFAKHLKVNKKEIVKALENFETYNVILDEIDRSIDHLNNLDQNKEYFKKKVNKIVTFLPLNQPLYALVCFGIVPSFMSESTYVRPPEIVQVHFSKLKEVLKLDKFFPNLNVFMGDRPSYYKLTQPAVDVVIFTGNPINGKRVYQQYKPKLFILNGAGHNPIVVTNTANIQNAVESTLRVTLQNQGQDCAAPNSILVQESVLPKYKTALLKKLKEIEPLVGEYKDKKTIVGPNSNPDALLPTLTILDKDKEFCIYGGDINIRKNMIYPTVFIKPLSLGPALKEYFAPIIMIQPYKDDTDLSTYFENPQYRPNAMYVTVFGESEYIKTLVTKGLHTHESIIYNTDLHKTERGFLPYGGLGLNASKVIIYGKEIAGATLPQRDIYEYLIK